MTETGVDILKGHCPECGGGRNAHVRGSHVVRMPDDGDGVEATETGMLLQCCGCDTLYFRRDQWCSEWDQLEEHPVTGKLSMNRGISTTYYPAASKRVPPKWIEEVERTDFQLGKLLSEVYTGLNADLRVLAAIGARTAFDRASELLDIDPTLTFERKLEALTTAGKISVDEKGILAVLVDAGGAAAHRGWRPKASELSTMMDVVEAFLHRSFILGNAIGKLKSAVPPRAPRLGRQP